VVWHHSLLLMNSFNKTEAAVFSCRLSFLRAFPFISLICVFTFRPIVKNQLWLDYNRYSQTPLCKENASALGARGPVFNPGSGKGYMFD